MPLHIIIAEGEREEGKEREREREGADTSDVCFKIRQQMINCNGID